MRGLTNEPLYVAPELAGARLASPMRRLLAFAVDIVLLIVPTVAVAVAAAIISLQITDPRAAHAIFSLARWPLLSSPGPAAQRDAIRDLIPLLVRTEAEGVPASVKVAVEEGDLNRAADLMQGRTITIVMNFAEGREKTALEPQEVRLELKEVIPFGVRALALLGVPALYFVAFTRSRRGATPGKRLLGIRVARLDGERLTWLESLERFIGYIHIPGTLFLGVADCWRDPNRRLPHDRVVHTAVFRVKRREAFPSSL